jgi:hypothetical protein
MGRELKRVPMDFNWPRNMTWKGYINPHHSQKCKACDGTGLNPATKQIADNFYDFDKTGHRWCDDITQDEVDALIAENRLWNFWRRVGPNGWEDIDPKPIVTAEMVNEVNRHHGFDSHDGINRCILIQVRAKRLGVYGTCSFCEGSGEIWASPEIKRLHEAWENFDPPTGDGYQLWETTSEGSPQSPVFKTLHKLCEWCAANATTFGSNTATAEEWHQMLDDGFVCHREGNIVFI